MRNESNYLPPVAEAVTLQGAAVVAASYNDGGHGFTVDFSSPDDFNPVEFPTL